MDYIQPVDRIAPSNQTKHVQEEYKNSTDGVSKPEVSKQAQRHYDEVEELLNQEDIESAVNKLNEHFSELDTQLEYRIHEGTNRIMVKLINKETKDVLKEIPSEKMLDLVENIWKNVGIIIDKHK